MLVDSQFATSGDGSLKIKNYMFVASTVAKQLTEVHTLADSQVASLADDSLRLKTIYLLHRQQQSSSDVSFQTGPELKVST